MPAGAYDRDAGSRAFRGMVERSTFLPHRADAGPINGQLAGAALGGVAHRLPLPPRVGVNRRGAILGVAEGPRQATALGQHLPLRGAWSTGSSAPLAVIPVEPT
jgi:hypothetical protein